MKLLLTTLRQPNGMRNMRLSERSVVGANAKTPFGGAESIAMPAAPSPRSRAALLVLGLVSLGWLAMIAYVFAGPDRASGRYSAPV